MEIVLNRRLVPGHLKRLEFVEREIDDPVEQEPGLTEFLQEDSLCGPTDTSWFCDRRFVGTRPLPGVR